MKTFDLIDIAFTGRERREEEADASLFDALMTGNLRAVAKQLYPEAQLGTCQICNERPGDLLIQGNSVCDECDQEHYGPIARLPRFRTNDDRDAYEAGSRTHGEI